MNTLRQIAANAVSLPVIAGIPIATDSVGRFNLNALHKASGLGGHKRPSKWLSTDPAKELIQELENLSPPAGFASIESAKGGKNPGTFAHELLAISYAGWISPSFQLKVNQVFIDYRTDKLRTPAMPQTLPDALRLAAELADSIAAIAPKAEAFDRIAGSTGSLCITEAAKDLQIRPKDLFGWLAENNWIYRRGEETHWSGYQKRINAGYLEHKALTVRGADRPSKIVTQVRITPKGLVLLAELFGREVGV